MQSAPVKEATAAGGVDQADLAHLASLVGGADPVQGVGSREAIGQEVQAAGPVARVDHGLGGHRADAGPGPGQHRAEGEVATLRGHAELAAVGVAGDDGVRHDARRSVQRGEEGQQGGVGLARVLLLDPVAGPLHRGHAAEVGELRRHQRRRHRASWSSPGRANR